MAELVLPPRARDGISRRENLRLRGEDAPLRTVMADLEDVYAAEVAACHGGGELGVLAVAREEGAHRPHAIVVLEDQEHRILVLEAVDRTCRRDDGQAEGAEPHGIV